MSSHTVLNAFPVVARAPNGMTRLRDLIAYFAISGGLSNRQDDDSDAQEILDDSLARKEEYLTNTGRRRSQRKHAQLIEVARRVPSHWIKINAGDLIDLINGRAFKAADWRPAGKPIIRIQNLNDRNAPFNHFEGDVDERHQVTDGDMLLSWSGTPGTSFGAFIWDRGESVLNQHIFKVVIFSELLDKEYLRIAINACLDVLIRSARGGVGLKHVTKGQIESLQIPIPPLEEQKRIVAKVAELMVLSDRLESQLNERAKLLPLLSRANHDHFVQEPTEENLKAIFHEKGSIISEDVRRTVFSMAVTGRLSGGSGTEGNAEAELQEIADEREHKLRTPNTETVSQLVNFELPLNWCWARFEDVAKIASNLVQPRDYLDMPHLAPDNIEKGTGVLLPCRTVREDKVKSANHRFFAGQIVYSKIRPNLSKVVMVDFDGLCSADMYPITPYIDRQYLLIVMLSDPFLIQSVRSDTRVAMPKINQKYLNAIAIPVPPLAEQQEIGRRVFRLLKLISELTTSQENIASTADAYARASVEAISNSHQMDVETMQAPRIEVVSELKVSGSIKTFPTGSLASLLADRKSPTSAKSLWSLSGLKIDSFYRQLKLEMNQGWIEEPSTPVIKEVEVG